MHKGKGNDFHFTPWLQVTKIGRDAVLYVESLIESIMGGLEGLINILDSEGGFGALEIQVITCSSYFVTSKQETVDVAYIRMGFGGISASSRAGSFLYELCIKSFNGFN